MLASSKTGHGKEKKGGKKTLILHSARMKAIQKLKITVNIHNEVKKYPFCITSHERQWVSQDSMKCVWKRSYQGQEAKISEFFFRKV